MDENKVEVVEVTEVEPELTEISYVDIDEEPKTVNVPVVLAIGAGIGVGTVFLAKGVKKAYGYGCRKYAEFVAKREAKKVGTYTDELLDGKHEDDVQEYMETEEADNAAETRK